jgi:hypothetical protein
MLLFSRLSNRTVVDNGQSLKNNSLYELRKNHEDQEHSVRCILNIENWTAWRLKDVHAENNCGYIHEQFPARNVLPATREVMVGHKQVLDPFEQSPIPSRFFGPYMCEIDACTTWAQAMSVTKSLVT